MAMELTSSYVQAVINITVRSSTPYEGQNLQTLFLLRKVVHSRHDNMALNQWFLNCDSWATGMDQMSLFHKRCGVDSFLKMWLTELIQSHPSILLSETTKIWKKYADFLFEVLIRYIPKT